MSRSQLLSSEVFLALLAALALFPAQSAYASLSVSLSPPFVEYVVKPGSSVGDAISYTNEGSSANWVTIELADFEVTEQGQVKELPPGTDATTLAPHVKFTPSRIRVAPRQTVRFRYTVTTPLEFRQKRVMVYFVSTPDSSEQEGASQVVVSTRLGVPIYLQNMQAEPARLRVDTVEWSRSPDSPDNVLLKLRVANEGHRNIRTSGEVHVRSKDGTFDRRYPFNEGREPVLPEHARLFEIRYGPIPGGELSVSLRFATSATEQFQRDFRIDASP